MKLMRFTILIAICIIPSLLLAEEKGCSQKNSNSCMEDGKKLLRDGKTKEGIALFEKACEYDNARGCLKAGVLAEQERRYDDAQKFYKKACDLNDDKTCKNLTLLDKARPKKN